MQKIIKNWIFTLVMTIVLALLAILMFLDGVGVADRFWTQSVIHEITAVFVACYVVLVLCPMIPGYQKQARYFALGEIAILILTVVGIFFNSVSEIRFIEKMVLCSVVGLVIWLRSVVETVDAFLKSADSTEDKPLPLWRLCLYILLAALGVWQMASPAIANRYLIFPISILTLLIAAGFCIATIRNRKRVVVARRLAAAEAVAEAEQPTDETEASEAEAESAEPPDGKADEQPDVTKNA